MASYLRWEGGDRPGYSFQMRDDDPGFDEMLGFLKSIWIESLRITTRFLTFRSLRLTLSNIGRSYRSRTPDHVVPGQARRRLTGRLLHTFAGIALESRMQACSRARWTTHSEDTERVLWSVASMGMERSPKRLIPTCMGC